MSTVANLLLQITVLAALISLGTAQELANSSGETRSIVVNVFDAQGNALTHLTKDSFGVLINGKPVSVLDARYSAAPRRMVVLLDMSASMTKGMTGPTGKWKIARGAVDELLGQTQSDVQIAMLTFAGEIDNVFDFPHSRTDITKWLESVPEQGPHLKRRAKTALFDAVLEGLRLLGTVQPGDAIYAITDGGENASHASAAQTKAALLQSSVRLFAFLLDEPSMLEHEGKNSFLQIVADSGGVWFGITGNHMPYAAPLDFNFPYDKDTREKIKLSTHDIDALVNGFWTLELAAPRSRKENKLKLNVLAADGKIRKDIGLTYPRLLENPN